MSEPGAKPVGGPGHVLVVDDQPGNRRLLADHVTLMGHRATAAESGRAALDLLLREPVDLVLLDVLMPGMDGFTVLERIKSDARLRAIPVLMVSGLDEIEGVVRCIEQGAEDYLIKPFDAVLLRARVDACLEKKRLRDEERRRTEELEAALRQLRAAQDQLIVQEKMASLGALTAGIAHEIRNPLNFVTNFAQLAGELVEDLDKALRAGPGGGGQAEDPAALLADLRQSLAKIQEHGRRADRIVNGMLLHARGHPGERRPADLNALVVEHVNLAYHGLRGRDAAFHVVIETDLDPALPPVPVFAQDLSRVVLNLAHNACYAAHERRKTAGPGFRPKVTVRTRDLGDRVEVRVRDNGAGIPVALRDKLFTPFFTTKPAGSGTGLGLSISYEVVVQMHQGTLRAESEEGKYAEFVVALPKAPARE